LGSPGGHQEFDAPIENVTTSKLEALRQYSWRRATFQAHYRQAIDFKKRHRCDPNFYECPRTLAFCYNNTGQFQASRAESTKATSWSIV
jgi:hypothetical protein